MSPIRPPVTVVGRRLSPSDHRLRDFLTRIAQPYEWVEAGTPEAERVLAARGLAGAGLPAVIEADGTVLAPASVELLAESWGQSAPPSRQVYDLIVIGAGPAGLAATVYAASDGLSTLLLDHDVPGGQASHTSLIENFFGFPEGIGGAELARRAGRQAEGFGAELVLMRGVTGSRLDTGGLFEVDVAGGSVVRASTIIAAPGMVWRRLDVPGVDDLLGRGVYYGAGRSEAARCRREEVVVVGAGNSAGQAVMDLSRDAAKVTMLVRGGSLEKSMSAYLVERIRANPRIDVRLRTEVQAVTAHDGRLRGVTARGPDGRDEDLPARALFLCLGGIPRTGWAPEQGVRTDPRGFILTGPDLLDAGRRPAGWPLERDPFAVETSVPGLFAAGDARAGSTKRVGGAVGDGAMAAALVHRRLDELARA